MPNFKYRATIAVDGNHFRIYIQIGNSLVCIREGELWSGIESVDEIHDTIKTALEGGSDLHNGSAMRLNHPYLMRNLE
jgi:methyl coenzyme M reductase subunit D